MFGLGDVFVLSLCQLDEVHEWEYVSDDTDVSLAFSSCITSSFLVSSMVAVDIYISKEALR